MTDEHAHDDVANLHVDQVGDSAARREQLRLLLNHLAILHADADQPIRARDGTPAPSMLYSWNVSLTALGAQLAAQCLLERLQTFESTQLAVYGYTGGPLLSACVLLGNGRYTGLQIREQRKTHYSCRRIEGPADSSRSVVVLDDSLSSGTSMRSAIQALEEDGFRVEGGLVLVNFPFRGGLEWAQALGYRMEAVFDAWTDLNLPEPHYVPGYQQLRAGPYASTSLDDGLHPALLARCVAQHYLGQQGVPPPPACLDQTYDGRGGVWVSFRDRQSDYRLARDGFWHFDPRDSDPCRDVVLATVKTLQTAGNAVSLSMLADLKIAVTFFGPLELIAPRQLDFARYGIVVRSQVWPAKIGGALPNTQVFTSEVEQYRHARVSNAKLGTYEPHDLFRHTVAKYVEPDTTWLHYGAPDGPDAQWTHDATVGVRLTERARQVLEAALAEAPAAGEPIPDAVIPSPISAVAVTLYHSGIVGCSVSWGGSLDACITYATCHALSDPRFVAQRQGLSAADLALTVSILHDREWLGAISPEQAAAKLRRGLDALLVRQEDRRGIFLPVAAVYFNWTKEQLARQLLHKTGIEKRPYTWTTFKTSTWLQSERGVSRIAFGFPERMAIEYDFARCQRDCELLAGYVLNHLGPDGLPEYLQYPLDGQHTRSGTAARVISGLVALAEAGRVFGRSDWLAAAVGGFTHCLKYLEMTSDRCVLALPGQASDHMACCLLLCGIVACDDPGLLHSGIHGLARKMTEMLQPDGRITATPNALGMQQDHDFLPGAVLVAIARYYNATVRQVSVGTLAAHLEWYRRRFRLAHPWGMVGWQSQAWAMMYNLTRDQDQASFVFELVDWALDWQLEKSGAFLTDLWPYGPSFHTAFVAEGVAEAWHLALSLDDGDRARKYRKAWEDAANFLTNLIIYPEDTFCMNDSRRSVGGVRGTLTTSDVRIDYVSHSILALVKGARSLQAYVN
jgi:orotate phosphoribosyltransferase